MAGPLDGPAQRRTATQTPTWIACGGQYKRWHSVCVDETGRWRGLVIAEGLHDPALINGFQVTKAFITDDGQPLDEEGGFPDHRFHGPFHVSGLRDGVRRDFVGFEVQRGESGRALVPDSG
jgi:hypothetical protein